MQSTAEQCVFYIRFDRKEATTGSSERMLVEEGREIGIIAHYIHCLLIANLA